jgi:hypothetical protein
MKMIKENKQDVKREFNKDVNSQKNPNRNHGNKNIPQV